MDQYIGKLLDNRYELQEVIGTGGMAVVYKARCHRLNRLVAVKVLKSDLAQDAEFRRRFHDESQAVAMLSHPNIVAVYDVSKSDDLNYIVMELIDGITLKQYMQKKGSPLNWREALHFITQIMKALGHAHSRGIIHRDIKPHNIMVLRDGSVKVADFGIARLVSATQNTLTQEALGSVHYISPEQARGSRVDERSDIYSAGVVLYEMICGRLPYEGDSPVSVAIQHINSIPLSPRELNPEIPEALEAITMKAMASNVAHRYESADAMLADLEEFRKNPSINFEFAKENLLLDANDEPTQVVNTGRSNIESRRRHSDVKKEEEKRNVWPVVVAAGAIFIFLAGIGYFLWSFFLSGLFVTSEPYVVPDFLGMTLEEVYQQELVRDGTFTIDAVYDYASEEYAENQVAKQDPEPNRQVKEAGTTITVYISSGAEELVMPAVYNKEQRTIEAQLKEIGITATFTPEYSEDINQGYATRSEPAEGTVLEEGQTVTVYISKGPEPKTVTVISYTGMSLDEATAKIQEAGLKMGETKEMYDDTVEAGYVVSQDVAATTQVLEGSTITLTVSLGPENTGTDNPDDTTDSSQTTPGGTNPSGGGTDAQATTKTLMVDLSEYTGVVNVKITVGGVVNYDNAVDADNMSSVNPSLTGSGVQEVIVYVNDAAIKQYTIDFSAP